MDVEWPAIAGSLVSVYSGERAVLDDGGPGAGYGELRVCKAGLDNERGHEGTL